MIENSFYHQLSAEKVPIHVAHGAADTLVPYQQALNSCGAIDNSVLPTDVIDPLTTYGCGTASQIQIVRDAQHALELGVCLGSVCPAGDTGSLTRDAVTSAIETAYLRLTGDPTTTDPEPPVVDDRPRSSGGGVLGWLVLFGLLSAGWRRFARQQELADDSEQEE